MALVDKRSNKGYKKITMSGIDTQTFTQIDFAVRESERLALNIQQIQWHIGDWIGGIAANTDAAELILSSSDELADLSEDNPSVLAKLEIVGMGVNVEPQISPLIMDFSGLMGGGLLVSPMRLFIGMDTTGFAAAASAIAWFYYTWIELSDREAFELLQAHLPPRL